MPRILELAAKGELMVDTFVVLGKLEYTRWQNWKEDEQDAVREFVIQWWEHIANERTYYDRGDFIELYKVIGDIDVMLGKWKVEAKSKSIIVFIEFIYNEFSDLHSYKGELYKLLGREGAYKTTAWALHQKHTLQEAFFYMEETEPYMAERASNALYILEH
ncbi:MAG: hypothetical protein JST49_00375 [Bacteroidetes bacterium]|nr:hypothetical protein [Bacteroidota bacterium]